MGARLVTTQNGATYLICSFDTRLYGSTVGPKLAAKLRQAATDFANAEARQDRCRIAKECEKLVDGFEFQDCHRAVGNYAALLKDAAIVGLPLQSASKGTVVVLHDAWYIEEEVQRDAHGDE